MCIYKDRQIDRLVDTADVVILSRNGNVFESNRIYTLGQSCSNSSIVTVVQAPGCHTEGLGFRVPFLVSGLWGV